jgi:hypothetical protein
MAIDRTTKAINARETTAMTDGRRLLKNQESLLAELSSHLDVWKVYGLSPINYIYLFLRMD